MVKKLLIILILICMAKIDYAQKLSPFDSLVHVLQKKFDVQFLYDTKHTEGLAISNAEGSLDNILRNILDGTGLSFYIDPYKRVIIARGSSVFTPLSKDFFKQTGTENTNQNTALENNEIVLVAVDNKIYTIGVKNNNAPSAIISGYVRDAKNGEPLSSTSVMVEGSQGGVSTDAFGFFSITVPKGRQVLRVSSVGMKEITRQLNILGNGKMDIEMNEEVRSLKTAVIVAQKQSNVRGMQMGVERLNIRAIKQIPAVLGETDILRSLQTLPGVTSVGEGTAGYNVRGGSADQNLILLNDMTIYNPTHLFGFFSAVDPEVIRGLELYKSAIPERLGGRISSIMDVSTKDGNAKKVTGTLGIGPLTSKFTLEGPLGSEKTTFLAGGRATYSNWFLKYLPDATFKKSKVSFADLMINLTHAFSEKDKLYVSGYISSDAFRLNQDSTYAYENKNARIKWKHNFTDKFYNVLSVGIEKFGVQQLSGKTDFKFIPTNKHEINFGLQHIVYHLDPGSLTPSNPASLTKATFVEKESGTETSIYFGDQYRVNNKIQLQGGLRYSYYRFAGPKKSYLYSPGIPRSESAVIDSVQFKNGETIQTYHGPELRASARYLISPRTSLKISYNSLRQYIHMITNTTAVSPTDIWKLSDQFIKPQVGHQLSLGFYTQPGNKGDEFSVEAYYKRNFNYLDYKSGAKLILNNSLERDVINTKGKAYGIEFLYKKPIGKLNGWISYTYLRTFLKVDDPIAGETINGGNFYPANFDKPHIASLVGNYRFTQRFSISLTSTYSTGRPITYPIGVFNMGGAQRVLYSERNAFRIPDFFRTDFSVILENNHKVTQKVHGSWTFGVYNIMGRSNPYSVYFIVNNREVKGYQMSVFANPIPFLTFNLKFN